MSATISPVPVQEWARELVAAMARLEPMQRLVVRSVYFEGDTRERAARRMSISAEAFARYLATGLQALGSDLTGLAID